jgi:hypothetical protein
MSHLPIERLAELTDGSPTLSEQDHLVHCGRCSQELEAYGRLLDLAADERRRIAPALTTWSSLSAGLAAEGIVARSGDAAVPSRKGTNWLYRVAAVACFVAVGVVGGRASVGFGTTAKTLGQDGEIRAAANSGTINSAQDALEQIESAQRAYDEAASYLAAQDTVPSFGTEDQYRARLAALDGASGTFQQALARAPRDPIINQYFMATMNAREATIRRLGTTLPVSVRIGRF